jgi:hypothetical protein
MKGPDLVKSLMGVILARLKASMLRTTDSTPKLGGSPTISGKAAAAAP